MQKEELKNVGENLNRTGKTFGDFSYNYQLLSSSLD